MDWSDLDECHGRRSLAEAPFRSTALILGLATKIRTATVNGTRQGSELKGTKMAHQGKGEMRRE
jgi:hypothetical protein